MEQTTYIGTKIVNAIPMNKKHYNSYRGWEIPDNEDPLEMGYLVEYLDGGKPNHPKHKGYISWSPATVFKSAYHKSGEMTFGDALEMLKRGFKVSRSVWNGKGMYIQGSHFTGVEPCFTLYGYGITNIWVPSVSDCYANDWGIVE